MVDTSAIVLASMVLGVGAYCYWVHHLIGRPAMSGDKWYIRQFAFTDLPISAPYRWRPLLPWLARFFGFRCISIAASVVTPFVIYYFAGAGWAGFCCAAIFVFNPHIFGFNIKNPEYTEGLGHLLLASTVFAMYSGHWLAFPLALLASLTRETLTAALGIVALFVNPLLLIPLAVGGVISLFARKESENNQHPLIEKTYRGTIERWVGNKGWKAFHFAHTVLPLRGAPFAVPFMWGAVGGDARLGLLAFVPIWLLALPASGQSRIICYGYIFLVPFIAALPGQWLWFFTVFACFWPVDWTAYDECGDAKFSFVR